MRALFFLSLFFSSAAYADYTCSGILNKINQGRAGSVSIISAEIYGDLKGRKICSLAQTWKDVHPEACKGWLAKVLIAKASGKSLTVQYVDSTSCTTQPTWNDANAPWGLWETR